MHVYTHTHTHTHTHMLPHTISSAACHQSSQASVQGTFPLCASRTAKRRERLARQEWLLLAALLSPTREGQAATWEAAGALGAPVPGGTCLPSYWPLGRHVQLHCVYPRRGITPPPPGEGSRGRALESERLFLPLAGSSGLRRLPGGG